MDERLLDRYGRKHRMMRSRALAYVTAQLQGWFWLPCPVCGEHFAGFETASHSVFTTTEGTYGTCSRAPCIEVGRAIYEKRILPWLAQQRHNK